MGAADEREPTNPGGHMGIGAIIFEGEAVLYEHSRHVPASKQNSNNVAEYMAMIAVLEWLIANNLTNEEVLVMGDSKLSVMQLAGSWNINQGIYVPLAHQAKKLAAIFSNIRFEWIPRNLNEHADTLSKKPLKAAGVQFWIQPNS